jgi:endonuclease/exonuclease/phosphatase family metal-dependent hydrolase
MRFRLLTWNIHKGIGGIDRRYRLDRVIDTLAHYAPDIVHLQEVTDGVPRTGRDRQAELIADALGLHHRAYQPNVCLSEGTYGNAILSRYPLHDVHDVDLKIPLKKQRRAQIARCRLRLEDKHSRTLILVNVHLGLAEFERRIQLRRVLACEALKHAHRDTPLIVAGDINDVLGRAGWQTMQPNGFRNGCAAFNTFPAFLPVRALDQIHFRGDLTLMDSAVATVPLASRASDHLPLIADFVAPAETPRHEPAQVQEHRAPAPASAMAAVAA